MTVPYQDMGTALAGLGIAPCTARIDSFTATEDIEFGYPVFSYPGEKNAYAYRLDTGKIAFDDDFVTANTIDITVNGVAMATVTFDTDHDTTADLVVDALNAMTGVEAVLDSTDTNNRTFLIRTKGVTAVVTENVLLGAGQVSGTISYESAQIFVGMCLRTMMPSSGTAKYVVTDEVNVLERGKLWAEAGKAVNANTAVYVESTGKVSDTAGLAIDCVFRGTVAAAGLVELEVNGQSEFTNANSF